MGGGGSPGAGFSCVLFDRTMDKLKSLNIFNCGNVVYNNVDEI